MYPPTADHPWQQLFWLLIGGIAIACVARTVVYEEFFREAREWCQQRSQRSNTLLQRKFFYLFTCEYCFSHYVTIFFLILTRFKLLLDDWRGYVMAFFSLVFMANAYLNLYARLRVDITQAREETKRLESETRKAHVEARKMEQEASIHPQERRRAG